MLKTAEDLLGPYVWGVYDLLVLPPSFPYGGMENPCLTFVTPTLLVRKSSHAIVLVMSEIFRSTMGFFKLTTLKNSPCIDVALNVSEAYFLQWTV